MARNGLFRAWVFVVSFWWIMGMIYVGVGDIKSYFSNAIESMFVLDVDALLGDTKPESTESISTSDKAHIETNTSSAESEHSEFDLNEWITPMMKFIKESSWTALSFLTLLLSAFLTTLYLIVWTGWSVRNTKNKLKPDPEWRGIGVNIGELKPVSWRQSLPEFNSNHIVFKAMGMDEQNAKRIQQLFDDLPNRYKAILRDIFWLLGQNKDAKVGHGHDQEDESFSLLKHTLRVVSEGWIDNGDYLLPIILAAHDLGKIHVWEQQGFDSVARLWTDKGYHDDRSGLLIAALDSFEALSENEQLILVVVVRYSHKSGLMPKLPEVADQQRAQQLINALKGTDRTVTKQEKEIVAQSVEENDFIAAFFKALDDMTWSSNSLPKGTPANAWRVDNECYVMEIQLRDFYLKRLGANLSAAFNNGHRNAGKPAEVTSHLLGLLKEKGYLLVEKNGAKIHQTNLWNIHIGKNFGFHGVIALKLPDDLLQFPQTNHEVILYPFDANIGEQLKIDEANANKTDEEKSALLNAAMMGTSVEKVRKAAKHNQAQPKNTHKTSPKPSQSTIEQPDDQSIVFDEKVAQNDLKESLNTDETLETPSNASPKTVQTANDPEGSPKTKSKRKRRKKPLNSQQQNESVPETEKKEDSKSKTISEPLKAKKAESSTASISLEEIGSIKTTIKIPETVTIDFE